MENNTAVIFGGNGQDGFYLKQILEANFYTTIIISRSGNGINGSIGDKAFVEQLIKQYQPIFIFHFAANSSTRHDALFDNQSAIVDGTVNILESARLYSPKARIFIAGSALQFKNEGLPINESTEFDASSPYAVARINAVYLARYFRSKFGMYIYVGYFFHHDSWLRTEKHVNKKISAAVVRIKNGSNEIVDIGNTSVKKEFNFAGDLMDAIWALMKQEQIFEAVIGCGKTHTIKEWIYECCVAAEIEEAVDHFIETAGYQPEYNILVSHPKKLYSLGWKPKTDFASLAKIMVQK